MKKVEHAVVVTFFRKVLKYNTSKYELTSERERPYAPETDGTGSAGWMYVSSSPQEGFHMICRPETKTPPEDLNNCSNSEISFTAIVVLRKALKLWDPSDKIGSLGNL